MTQASVRAKGWGRIVFEHFIYPMAKPDVIVRVVVSFGDQVVTRYYDSLIEFESDKRTWESNGLKNNVLSYETFKRTV
jgi:hypothetical protein